MKRSSKTPNSKAADLKPNDLTLGSPAKMATVVVSVRMSERLKGFLVSTAQTKDLALSPFIERLLWQSQAVQELLVGDAPKAVARRWTLDEIGLAHFGQLAVATNSLDRLVVALERTLREAKAVDALRVYEIAHAIEQQLGRLQTLNVVRAKAAGGTDREHQACQGARLDTSGGELPPWVAGCGRACARGRRLGAWQPGVAGQAGEHLAVSRWLRLVDRVVRTQ